MGLDPSHLSASEKHDKVLKQEEQERVIREEKKNKSESKKTRAGFNQDLLEPSIYEEDIS